MICNLDSYEKFIAHAYCGYPEGNISVCMSKHRISRVGSDKLSLQKVVSTSVTTLCRRRVSSLVGQGDDLKKTVCKHSEGAREGIKSGDGNSGHVRRHCHGGHASTFASRSRACFLPAKSDCFLKRLINFADTTEAVLEDI